MEEASTQQQPDTQQLEPQLQPQGVRAAEGPLALLHPFHANCLDACLMLSTCYSIQARTGEGGHARRQCWWAAAIGYALMRAATIEQLLFAGGLCYFPYLRCSHVTVLALLLPHALSALGALTFGVCCLQASWASSLLPPCAGGSWLTC